jgi:hypothetical protein
LATSVNSKRGFNPFYVLVVVVGTAFTVTAFAYGVMAFRVFHTSATPQADAEDSGERLMALLDRRGLEIMGAELAILGVASVAAMSSDRWWGGR